MNPLEEKVKLSLYGLSYNKIRPETYALILAEDKGPRKIPIIIGSAEAKLISKKIDPAEISRPAVHDLIAQLSEQMFVSLREVVINRFDEGVFFSELVFLNEQEEIRLDARTSDAIAIAMRMNAPIYVIEKVIQQTALIFDVEEKVEAKEKDISSTLSASSESQLKALLEHAIAKEDFELALEIKKELAKRAKES